MAQFLCHFIVFCVSVALVKATGKSSVTKSPVTTPKLSATQRAVTQDNITSFSGPNETFPSKPPGESDKPPQTPDNGLTTLAFGVMTFILILIIVMVILVTAVNLKERCNNTKEEGVKNYGSVISEGHISNIGARESIMLVSMRTINTDADTDSPRISSIYSTALDNEDQ